MFDYGDKTLIFEVRGLETAAFKNTQARIGVIFEGDERPLNGDSVVRHGDCLRRRMGTKSSGSTGTTTMSIHFVNFLDAVRSRKVADLNADILEGHRLERLCHLGNISYVLGKQATHRANRARIAGIRRRNAHKRHSSEPRSISTKTTSSRTVKLQLGAVLAFDPNREEFVDNPDGEQTADPQYRAPFVVPTADKL